MSASDTLVPELRSSTVEEAIRRRAEQLYVQRGKVPGHEIQDWLQAEAEVTGKIAQPGKSAFVIIRFQGATYTGEYDVRSCADYRHGEFCPGSPVEISFNGDKMYLKRPNGKELETRVVKKEKIR